eukprot:7367124-Pyramimonas_sp.AAC.2
MGTRWRRESCRMKGQAGSEGAHLGVVAQRLAVQAVKHGVAGAVSGGGAAVGLATTAVVQGLAAEGTLVDLALLCGTARSRRTP